MVGQSLSAECFEGMVGRFCEGRFARSSIELQVSVTEECDRVG